MLVAPFHVGGRDRRAVVELDPLAQSEGRGFGVLGKVEFVGERQVIVFLLAEVLGQAVLQAR